jgi:hypothetical protein
VLDHSLDSIGTKVGARALNGKPARRRVRAPQPFVIPTTARKVMP